MNNKAFDPEFVIASIDGDEYTAKDALACIRSFDHHRLNNIIAWADDTNGTIDLICDHVLAYAYGTYGLKAELLDILNDRVADAYYRSNVNCSDDLIGDMLNAYKDALDVIERTGKALGCEVNVAPPIIDINAADVE